MALNEVKRDAFSISVPVTSAVESEDLVGFNSGLVGVAETDAKLAEDGVTYRASIRTIGVFRIPVGSASNPSIGNAVFISPPVAGPGAPVTLAATGTKVGTIVGLPKDTGFLEVALNI